MQFHRAGAQGGWLAIGHLVLADELPLVGAAPIAGLLGALIGHGRHTAGLATGYARHRWSPTSPFASDLG